MLLKNRKLILPLLASILLLGQVSTGWADPPFFGTVFIDPDIITADDPTTYVGLTDAGRDDRWMYDRRHGWVFLNAFLFNASYSNGQVIEVQVNPEFEDVNAARAEALKYAPVIGRLPRGLLADAQTVWIHAGTHPFGGGNNNLLIHTGQAAFYEADGILEEVLVHEAAHTSLDAYFAEAPGWLAAQAADARFISTYAQQYPMREDIAESVLPWLALRYRRDRIPDALAETILETIPNRIAFFDAQRFDMYPLVGEPHYSNWLKEHLSIDSTGPGDDPDGDGIPNLLEFALGGDPTVPNRAILGSPALGTSTPAAPSKDQFTFSFARRADSIPEVDLVFQHSLDMQSWSDIPIEPCNSSTPGPVTLGPIGGGIQPVTVTLQPVTAPKLFVRLKANAVHSSGETPACTGWMILSNGE